MSWSFYELKYRVIETFYDAIINENLNYNTAAERTFYEFHQEMRENSVEKIILIITIERRILEHKAISEASIKYVKEAIDLLSEIDVKSELNDKEYEVLCEEISDLKIELRL